MSNVLLDYLDKELGVQKESIKEHDGITTDRAVREYMTTYQGDFGAGVSFTDKITSIGPVNNPNYVYDSSINQVKTAVTLTAQKKIYDYPSACDFVNEEQTKALVMSQLYEDILKELIKSGAVIIDNVIDPATFSKVFRARVTVYK